MNSQKAELLAKLIEEGRLTMNEARILADLSPIEEADANKLIKKA